MTGRRVSRPSAVVCMFLSLYDAVRKGPYAGVTVGLELA